MKESEKATEQKKPWKIVAEIASSLR